MNRRSIISLLFGAAVLFGENQVKADTFSPAEQQQINIETSGLFDKSKSFTVDFTQLKSTDYCFPLPVGRASAHTRGMAIKSVKGDAVKAMFDGVVRMSRFNVTYGNVVVIRHRNGLETVYANNAQNLVNVGDRVKAGQTIAIIGDEGGESVCYVGIMVNGNNINPATLVGLRSHELMKHIFLFKDEGKSVDVAMLDDGRIHILRPGVETEAAVDMDGEFTSREQQVVSAPTTGLFSTCNTVTINLASFTPTQWCYPLPGCHVISPYGGKRRHSGVDLKTKPNDNILAAFDGKVRFSGPYSGYGNVVVIRHACGIETLYSHNSRNLVKVGDWVKAGQPIALTGRTGRATTEHLHFELRINGRAYNPTLVFDHTSRQLRHVKLVAYKSGRVETITVPGRMAQADDNGGNTDPQA